MKKFRVYALFDDKEVLLEAKRLKNIINLIPKNIKIKPFKFENYGKGDKK